MAVAATGEISASGRPMAQLAVGQLIRISMFWLGLTAIDAVVNAAVQTKVKFDGLAAPGTVGTSLAIIAASQFIFSVAVQPTVGAISDYADTKWGRRKPFIVVGALLDAVFLVGIAFSNTLLALAAFVVLLSLSTNTARGPFQGYVPDLVPDQQVGMASSMVGLFQVLGNVLGFLLGGLALSRGSVEVAVLAVAVIEVGTMLSVVLRVPKGPPAKPRNGRSWFSVAAETWGTDILRERSYVWLLISRLFILMGGAALLNFMLSNYLPDSHHLTQEETGLAFIPMLGLATLFSLLAIVPASRLSDRIGRKPVIYGCSAIGALGLAMIAFAPNIPIATIGAGLFGASQGTFLSVDWALMTDIIPKASSGRYMGLSNVVTASATTIAVVIGGPVIDLIDRGQGPGVGARVEILFGVAYFILGALALRPVVEPARRRPDAPPPPPALPAEPTAAADA
jgi:MFS family permease